TMMPTSMIEFANMIRPATPKRTHRLRRPTGPAGPFDMMDRFCLGMEPIVPPVKRASAGPNLSWSEAGSSLISGRISPGQRPSREPRSEPGRGSGHGTGHRCPSEREADRPGRHRRAHEHLVVADAGGRFDRVEHG